MKYSFLKQRRFGGPRELPLNGRSHHESFIVTLQNVIHEIVPERNLGNFSCEINSHDASELFKIGETFTDIQPTTYPHILEVESACLKIIAEITNVDLPKSSFGISCAGVTEAATFVGSALKQRWQARYNLPHWNVPNLIFSQHASENWNLFCSICDITSRIIPSALLKAPIVVDRLAPYVDSNTIGIVGTIGSPLTGNLENIEELHLALNHINATSGLDIPIHVDASIGGLPAHFLSPKRIWDFRIPRVSSLNISGHQCGFTSSPIHWILWRRDSFDDDDIKGTTPNSKNSLHSQRLTIPYSMGAILSHYYTFIHLGRAGFRELYEQINTYKLRLIKFIDTFPEFEIISEVDSVPAVVWIIREHSSFTATEVSHELRRRGWIVPHFTLPVGDTDLSALRIVIRSSYTARTEELLFAHILEVVEYLRNQQLIANHQIFGNSK